MNLSTKTYIYNVVFKLVRYFDSRCSVISNLFASAFIFFRQPLKRHKNNIKIQNKALLKQTRLRNAKLYPIEWLDLSSPNIIRTFETEIKSNSFGPKINGSSKIKKVVLPAVNLYYFENARVCSRSSSIVLNDKIIIERVNGVDVDICDFSTGHIIKHDSCQTFVTPTVQSHTFESGIFLAGNGSSNYYHWMIEILPKLQYIKNLNDNKFKNFPLLISEDIIRIKSFREALNYLSDDRPVVVMDKKKAYNVKKLLYLSSINLLPFNIINNTTFKVSDFLFRNSSIEFLRKEILSKVALRNNSKIKRIFFARRGNRRQYNQNEVFSIFEKYGFIRVFMEDLSFKDQISLMYNSENIAGPTGASWTNIIFCSHEVKGLMWMPDLASEFSAFSNLAQIIGADLSCFTFPLRTESFREIYHLDYVIDTKKLNKILLEEVKQSNK